MIQWLTVNTEIPRWGLIWILLFLVTTEIYCFYRAMKYQIQSKKSKNLIQQKKDATSYSQAHNHEVIQNRSGYAYPIKDGVFGNESKNPNYPKSNWFIISFIRHVSYSLYNYFRRLATKCKQYLSLKIIF